MVVRLMTLTPILHCDKSLGFQPRAKWSPILPAFAWRGVLLCGFERTDGHAVELSADSRYNWVDAFTACHTQLGLGELARLSPLLSDENRSAVFEFYGLRWSDRLSETLAWLARAPLQFQNWVDEKKLGARDLAPLLALPEQNAFATTLLGLMALSLSKSQAVRALENIVDLHLMGKPLNELLPKAGQNTDSYLQQLETWRRPRTAESDQSWQEEVSRWPWPAQVQGEWRRQGDQAGLEVKLRAVSPLDLKKKLERLNSIGENWSCKN